MIATSGFLTAPECTKFVFGRGFAQDPAGGAYDAPPDPLQCRQNGTGTDDAIVPSIVLCSSIYAILC